MIYTESYFNYSRVTTDCSNTAGSLQTSPLKEHLFTKGVFTHTIQVIFQK